jgi:hypothetical protein
MNKFLILFAGLLSFSFAGAQDLDSTLAKYGDQYQPEKVYLHYDKASYYAGETIWFKAYLMEAFLPARGSKTLYIDWVSDNGSVLYHSVSPVVDAVTTGQFEIPGDYTGNFIHIRAYTKWMLNFDTAFFYSKDLRVLTKNPVAKSSKPVIIPSVAFFPEGGDAITGISNRIAFKATDQFGRPVRIRGVVQDNKGVVIDSLKTLHDGMGSFHLIPREGTSYSAKWKDEKGAEHVTPLAAAKSAGISMQLVSNGTRRNINLIASADIPDQLKTLHLVGTLNQRMAFKSDVAMTAGGSARRIIPTENFTSGILVITLFDSEWNPIAERICFVNNHDYSFQTSMEVEHWGLSKRKKNQLKITLPDSLVGASLSISVTDAAIEKDTSDNIISHFLLASEIKGRVYNPAYYFSNTGDSVEQHLDLVMMTNGWRRFKWPDIVKGKLPLISFPKDTNYLTLSGKIFGVPTSQLSGKESIALLVKEKDSATKLMILPIERTGEFGDPNVLFFDTLQVYYSLKSKFLSLAEARFMTARLPAPNYVAFSKNFLYNPFYDTSGVYRHSLLADKSLELMNIQKGTMMENVIIKTKQKSTVQVMDEKYASGMFQGGDGYQFDLVNDPLASSYMNILNYLQGKVAGLQISSGSPPALSWRGGAPQLYLDEIQTDADMITSIPVTDVAYVKVFRPPFMGGFGGANGAIAIYTRRGNDAQTTSKGLSANKISGYTPIKEFYAPNYDSFDPRNEHLDIRTTLFWDPEINDNKKNKTILVSFFNNDVTESFRVVIEGMTKDGLLTHMEQIME